MGGSIVLTSSSYGFKPAPTRVGYSAAKAGIVAMTRSLAILGAEFGVRVNCVAPGPTNTVRIAADGQSLSTQSLALTTPLGRLSEPADVASAIAYALFSARTMTGQVIHINSGKFIP